jgi:hypothetical protein
MVILIFKHMRYVNVFSINYIMMIIIAFNFTATSCSSEAKKQNLNKQLSNDIDSSDIITSKDTKDEIRIKLKKGARLDKYEFEEKTIYDSFFKDEVTKFIMKDKEGSTILSAVVYNDRLRYMKMLLQHIGDTSKLNKEKHYRNILDVIEKTIKDGEYQKYEKNYLKGLQNNDPFIITFVLNENKTTGTQNYWSLMAPESEVIYLKHMVNSFQNVSKIESRFIISN